MVTCNPYVLNRLSMCMYANMKTYIWVFIMDIFALHVHIFHFCMGKRYLKIYLHMFEICFEWSKYILDSIQLYCMLSRKKKKIKYILNK